MLAKCANPSCSKSFLHLAGRTAFSARNRPDCTFPGHSVEEVFLAVWKMFHGDDATSNPRRRSEPAGLAEPYRYGPQVRINSVKSRARAISPRRQFSSPQPSHGHIALSHLRAEATV